jgi:isoamylase
MDGLGVNFALFSGNATKVELCLFDADGRTEIERIALPEFTDEVWHGNLPDARPGTIYGYRVYGPTGVAGRLGRLGAIDT